MKNERRHTLPNGVQIQVRDGQAVDINLPGKDAWLTLTQDPRDSHMLAAFLSIELAPIGGRSR